MLTPSRRALALSSVVASLALAAAAGAAPSPDDSGPARGRGKDTSKARSKGRGKDRNKDKAAAPEPFPPLGLPEPSAPTDNVQTPDKAALGRQVFWDARLSRSGKTSCESCHHPDKGWADGETLSKKDDGSLNTRHTPTVLNAAYATSFYWDGRAPTLEKQILAAWKGQMGVGDDKTAAEIAAKLGEVAGYKDAFKKVFGAEPTADTVVKALAAYLRTLVSGNSAWDRSENGDDKALSPAARRGADLFKTKARCTLCHAGFALTAWEFRNIGVGMDRPSPDAGRGKIEVGSPKLLGAFKVPSLRNVARTAPYMHDGRFATLDAVLDYFEKPTENPNLDERVKGGIKLSADERKDLLEFLKALDGTLPDGSKPTLP